MAPKKQAPRTNAKHAPKKAAKKARKGTTERERAAQRSTAARASTPAHTSSVSRARALPPLAADEICGHEISPLRFCQLRARHHELPTNHEEYNASHCVDVPAEGVQLRQVHGESVVTSIPLVS